MKVVPGRLVAVGIPSRDRLGMGLIRAGRDSADRFPRRPSARLRASDMGREPNVDVGRPSEGKGEIMSAFITRVESETLIVKFEAAAGLNDFRNNALRDALYELVQNRAEPALAVDLQHVDYLSSSGVAILVGLKRRVDTRNGKIVLFHVQPVVRDLLAVMKLDRYFAIADNEAQALASLRPLPTA